MKKNLIKKIVLSSLGLLLLLSGVLVYHIYSVTRTRNDFRTTRQLSRIDFTQKIDSSEASSLRYYVAGLEGVESTYYNYQNNILVYTYYPDRQSSSNVFDMVMKQGNYEAKKYTVNEDDMAKGCPVMDKNSFSYRTSNFVASLFK